MEQEFKVLVSKERGNIPVWVSGDVIHYNKLLDGEELVAGDGFLGKYKPNIVKGAWVETATPEEIAAIEATIIRPKEKITLDGLDISEAVDLLRWVGAI